MGVCNMRNLRISRHLKSLDAAHAYQQNGHETEETIKMMMMTIIIMLKMTVTLSMILLHLLSTFFWGDAGVRVPLNIL
jgi:hypothetical protein